MDNDGNIRNIYSAPSAKTLKQSLAVSQRTDKCIGRLTTKF